MRILTCAVDGFALRRSIHAFDLTLRVPGAACIAMGIACAVGGDKRRRGRGPFISRIAFLSQPQAKSLKWMKWVIGGALVYAGVELLSRP